ncbi:MAG: HI0074 family nucleotidyltransferase substrate-binding subunit [Chitinispirillaceae bacterium]
MEKIKKTFVSHEKALLSLEQILNLSEDPIVRDASIQRFEYTVETFWKLLKIYLYDHEGLECNSPKSCMRKAFEVGLFDDTEAENALFMCNDRNLTSHTYIEAVAKIIYKRLPLYASIMRSCTEKIRPVAEV